MRASLGLACAQATTMCTQVFGKTRPRSLFSVCFLVLSACACSPEVTVTSSSPTPFVSPRGLLHKNQCFSCSFQVTVTSFSLSSFVSHRGLFNINHRLSLCDSETATTTSRCSCPTTSELMTFPVHEHVHMSTVPVRNQSVVTNYI